VLLFARKQASEKYAYKNGIVPALLLKATAF